MSTLSKLVADGYELPNGIGKSNKKSSTLSKLVADGYELPNGIGESNKRSSALSKFVTDGYELPSRVKTKSSALSKLNTGYYASPKTVNNGGVLGGIGYVGARLGLGAFGILEGIWDFSAGGIAKMVGADDWAEEQFANNITGNALSDLDDWYNPSKGWQFAGDVASGIGNSLVGVGVTAGVAGLVTLSGGTLAPAVVSAISASVIGLGAAGQSVTDAYMKTGELGGKEFAYGALSGVAEAGLEYVSGAASKVGKTLFAKQAAKALTKKSVVTGIIGNFAGEAFEEGMSEILDPYFQRWTKVDPNAENASPSEIGYAAVVGGLSGVIMGGFGSAVSSLQQIRLGNNIAKNEAAVAATIDYARDFANYEQEHNTGYQAYREVGELLKKYEAADAGDGSISFKQKKLLGQMCINNSALIHGEGIQRSKQKILAHSESFVNDINKKGYTDARGNTLHFSSASEFTANDELVTKFATMDYLGRLLMSKDSFYDLVASKGRSDGIIQADFRNFQKEGTKQEKASINEIFGIDVDSVTYEDFIDTIQSTNRDVFDSRRESVQMRTQSKKAILQAEGTSADAPLLDSHSAFSEGINVFKTKDGKYVAVATRGDNNYLYADGNISKPLTAEKLAAFINAFNGDGETAAKKETSPSGDANTYKSENFNGKSERNQNNFSTEEVGKENAQSLSNFAEELLEEKTATAEKEAPGAQERKKGDSPQVNHQRKVLASINGKSPNNSIYQNEENVNSKSEKSQNNFSTENDGGKNTQSLSDFAEELLDEKTATAKKSADAAKDAEFGFADSKGQKLTLLEMKRAESVARNNIKGYELLTEAEKLEVEWTLASAWRAGKSNGEALELARLSTAIGAGVGFADVSAITADGRKITADAVCYTIDGHLTIYINPLTKRTVECAALHELVHAMEGMDGYSELKIMAEEYYANHPDEKAAIDGLYKDVYKNEQLKYAETILPSELTAHYVETVLAKSNMLAKLSAEKPGFVMRCIERLSDVRNALVGMGGSETAEIARLETKFKRIFNSNKGNIADRSGVSTSNATIKQFSIQADERGRQYVQADRRVIFGNEQNAWKSQITRYINEAVRRGNNIKITTVEGDILTITRNTAGKAAFQNKGLSSDGFKAKLNAEAHIDELSEISTSNKNADGTKKITPDQDSKHAKRNLAKDGWSYRTAYFRDFDGKFYKLQLSVAIDGTVESVYNINKLKETSSKACIMHGMPQRALDVSNNIVSEKSKNVNSKSEKSQKIFSTENDGGKNTQSLSNFAEELLDEKETTAEKETPGAQERKKGDSPQVNHQRKVLAIVNGKSPNNSIYQNKENVNRKYEKKQKIFSRENDKGKNAQNLSNFAEELLEKKTAMAEKETPGAQESKKVESVYNIGMIKEKHLSGESRLMPQRATSVPDSIISEKSKNVNSKFEKSQNNFSTEEGGKENAHFDNIKTANKSGLVVEDSFLSENVLEKLGKYTDEEIASIERTKTFKVARSYSDVEGFIASSRNGLIQNRLFLGKINDATAAMILSETGIDVNGKSLALSSDDVRRILAGHGENGTGLHNGDIAVTQENFENIIEALIEPDRVSRSDRNETTGIVFQKNIDGKIAAVTVVSEKEKTLTLKSAWIIKQKQATSPSFNAETLNITSETLPRIKPVFTDSVYQNEENVNSKSEKNQKKFPTENDKGKNAQNLSDFAEELLDEKTSKTNKNSYLEKKTTKIKESSSTYYSMKAVVRSNTLSADSISKNRENVNSKSEKSQKNLSTENDGGKNTQNLSNFAEELLDEKETRAEKETPAAQESKKVESVYNINKLKETSSKACITHVVPQRALDVSDNIVSETSENVNSKSERSQNNFSTEEGEVKPSNKETTARRYVTDRSFSEQVYGVLAGNHATNYDLYVGETPQVLRDIGFENKPLLMRNSKVSEIISKHSEMSVELLKEIPQAVADPVMIIKSKTNPTVSVVVITDIQTSKGKMNIPVRINQEGAYLDVEVGNLIKLNTNFIASAYGRSTKALVEYAINNNGVLFYAKDKKRVSTLLATHGLQLPARLSTTNFTNSISEKSENVNSKSEKSQKIFSTENDGGKNTQNLSNFAEELSDEKALKTNKNSYLEKKTTKIKESSSTYYSMKAAVRSNALSADSISKNSENVNRKSEKNSSDAKNSSAVASSDLNSLDKTDKTRYALSRRKARLEQINEDATRNGFIDGRISRRLGNTSDSGSNSSVGQVSEKDLSAVKEKSPNNQRGISAENEAGRGAVQAAERLAASGKRHALTPESVPGSESVLTELPDGRVSFKDVVSGKKSTRDFTEQIKADGKELTEGWQIATTNAQATLERVLRETGSADATAVTNYVRAAKNAAHSSLTVGQYTLDGEAYVGESWESIWRPVYAMDKKDGQAYEMFNLYLLHWHNTDRYAAGKQVFRSNVTASDSVKALRLIEAEYPNFRKTAEKVWKFNGNNLQLAVDGGIISAEYADAVREMYPHYVPTMRDGSVNSGKRATAKKRAKSVSSGINTAIGSELDILPIDEAVAQQTVRRIISARINKMLLDIKNGEPHGEFTVRTTEDAAASTDGEVDFLPTADKTDGGYRVTFFENGKSVTAAVSKNVYRGIEAFMPSDDAAYNNVIIGCVANANSLFKKLVTAWNPVFVLFKNPIRDIQTALNYTRYSWHTYAKNCERALNEIFGGGRYWREARAAGILSASVYDYRKGLQYKNKGKASQVIGKIEFVANAIEMVPRLAEYISARESGLDVREALLQAQDVTTNFGRSGTLTKKANATFMPFLNPAVQGFSKMVRAYTGKDAARSWINLIIRSLILGVGLSALNDLLNEDDDDYQNLSDYVKNNNYVLALGDGKFLKIPKGRENGFIGELYLRARRYASGEADAWDGTVESFVSNLTPTDNFTRTIFSPLVDVGTNTTWYGGTIEGQKWSNTEPKNRYDESTSGIAIWLGNRLNYSPIKIDYLLEQYFGIAADVVLPATSLEAETGVISKNLIADSANNSRWSTQFYSQLEKYNYKKTAGDMQAKGTLKYLNNVGESVNELYGKKSAIQSDKSLTNAEKLAQVKLLQTAVNALRKESVTNAKLLYTELGKYDLTTEENFNTAYLYSTAAVLGEEYALKLYNKNVYEKARSLNILGVDYGVYFDYYFALKDITSDKDASGATVSGSKKKKVIAYTLAQDIPAVQKLILIMSAGYKISDGDIKGLTKKQAKTYVAKYIAKLGIAKEKKAELAALCGLTVRNGRISVTD